MRSLYVRLEDLSNRQQNNANHCKRFLFSEVCFSVKYFILGKKRVRPRMCCISVDPTETVVCVSQSRKTIITFALKPVRSRSLRGQTLGGTVHAASPELCMIQARKQHVLWWLDAYCRSCSQQAPSKNTCVVSLIISFPDNEDSHGNWHKFFSQCLITWWNLMQLLCFKIHFSCPEYITFVQGELELLHGLNSM